MFSSPKEKSDSKQEENSADHNELELLEVKLSKTKDGFAEDLKQLEMFSLRLKAEEQGFMQGYMSPYKGT